MSVGPGSCEKPLPSTIDPSQSGRGVFINSPDTADGVAAVSVLTYDLLNDSTKKRDQVMAAAFCVPPDSQPNGFAVGVFDINTKCDESLYNRRVHGEQAGLVMAEAKDGLTFTIVASVTGSKTADLTVQLFSGSSMKPLDRKTESLVLYHPLTFHSLH